MKLDWRKLRGEDPWLVIVGGILLGANLLQAAILAAHMVVRYGL